MSAAESVLLVLTNISPRCWSATVDSQRRVIGRSAEADIRIPPGCGYVSRRHAEVWTDRRGIWIRDLGSRFGTAVNDVWIDHVPQAQIAIGDRIWIGGAVVLPVRAAAIDDGAPADEEDLETTPELRGPAPPGRELASLFSPSEVAVFLCLTRGYDTDDEIAAVLTKSPSTIHSHIQHMLAKLGLHSRSALVGWLRRGGWPQGHTPPPPEKTPTGAEEGPVTCRGRKSRRRS